MLPAIKLASMAMMRTDVPFSRAYYRPFPRSRTSAACNLFFIQRDDTLARAAYKPKPSLILNSRRRL
jgi:hypothetical protein